MAIVIRLLNANVNLDGKECSVTSLFVATLANMEHAINQENAFAIQDGQVQIATFVSSSRAVPNMGTAPNPWNVFATTDSKVISATKPNAEKIATQQLVFAITHMNVGAI
jgi:hypothetical protein